MCEYKNISKRVGKGNKKRRYKKMSKTKVEAEIVKALCGRECKGNGGKAAHERSCNKCKELAGARGAANPPAKDQKIPK